MLVANGASIYAKTVQGINMMHVAAQGDQAYSLTYFKDQGLNLQQRDNEESTPLHWACFAGSDTAVYYLLAWDKYVNARDNAGNTPLHMAVSRADSFPNLRSIKELLIKGADRNAVNNEGKRPYDLIEQHVKNSRTKRELIPMLDKQSTYIPCCHFKQPM